METLGKILSFFMVVLGILFIIITNGFFEMFNDSGGDYVNPFAYIGIGIVALGIYYIFRKSNKKENKSNENVEKNKNFILYK